MNLFYMTSPFELNRMKKIYTLLFSILTIAITQGQNMGEPHRYNQNEKYYPKPPDVSSFEKFVNIPQGNYTGVHGYSIPIYSIQGKEFSFPISINYHGMGVNANEVSGVTGLGWTLSIGGVSLSQEIRGYDDATSSKIYFEHASDFHSANTYPHDDHGSIPQSEQYWNAIKIAGGYESGHISYLTNSPPADEYEFNPDYFSYSLLNNSGKYIMDRDADFQTIPKDNVSISGNINNVTLTDKNGIQYNFTRYHYSNNISGLSGTNESYAYKLQSIYFPESQSTMSFTYIETSYKYISNYQHSRSYILSGTTDANAPLLSQETSSKTATDVVTEFLISKITYKDTEVNFTYAGEAEYSNGRKDLNGGKRLSKIEVKFKPGIGAEKVIKDYQINTSYTESSTGAPSVADGNYPGRTFIYRLRLNSISELISGTNYSFDYEDSKLLPARFSQYTDWWGSYTKPKYMNDEYLSSFLYKDNVNGEQKYFDGTNKEADLEYAVTGTLKRVHFPTGGFQEFHYELDEYKFHDSERKYEPLSFNPGAWSSSNPNAIINIVDIAGPDYREGIDYRLTFQTIHENCDYDPSNGGMPTGHTFTYFLYKENGVNDILIHSRIIDNDNTYQLPEFNINSEYYIKIEMYVHPNPTCSQELPVNITAQINYVHESEPIYIKNKNAGHLRVGAITLHDSNGDTIIKRSFEYKSFSDKTFSSGVFTGIPIHKKQEVLYPGYNSQCSGLSSTCETTSPGTKQIFSSNPALNLNVSFGKSVFYENVTEIYEDLKIPTNSYRKELVFQLPSKEGYPDDESPTTYWPHNEYTGGQLLEERLYDNTYNPSISDNTPSLVKKITNQYSEPDYHFNAESSYYEDTAPFAVGFGVAATLRSYFVHDCSDINCDIRFVHDTNAYFITSGWVKHLSTKEEDYQNGSLKMTNKTDYQYSPIYAHLNPVSVTSTNSLGQVLKSEYVYAHPYKKSEPTKVIQKDGTTEISIEETTFNPSGLPQYVFAKRGASTLDNIPPSEDLKVTYDSYDAKGNLTQYTTENGIPVSIIWGYNGQYPIAKVEGAAYNTLSSYISVLQPASNNGTLTAASFETLRNLSGATVTSYIYQPLVGVKEIISPNGQKEIYEYDTSGKLEYVKDHNGNILKKIDYNYKD